MLRPLLLALVAALAAAPARAQSTELVSRNDFGTPADSTCLEPAISADGRFVAFSSYAGNLVMGDNNLRQDVFVRDTLLDTIERVSVGTGGVQGDERSFEPAISADGRWVAFSSYSTTFSPLDLDDDMASVYLRDRLNGTTALISIGYASGLAVRGGQPAVSDDGRWVAFASSSNELAPGDTNGKSDIFAHDTVLGYTIRVSVTTGGQQGTGGNSGCFQPSISADGTRIAFASDLKNLVAGDTNFIDIFAHDLQAGWTRLVSVDSAGVKANNYSSGPSISRDGGSVAFASLASDLTAGDTNNVADVFVHELDTGLTERVSVSSAGSEGDLGSGTTSIFGLGSRATLSEDGRYVAFTALATNLVSGDGNGKADVFRHDRATGSTVRVSVSGAGLEADDISTAPWISADGARVAFQSNATNLVSPPPLILSQIYLREPGDCPPPLTHCTAKTNSQGCVPQIAWSGTPVAGGAAPFDITADEVINQQVGILIYGKSGPAAIPFQDGLLCAAPPVVRTGALLSGGGPPPDDCSGSFSFDFAAWLSAGSDSNLVVGAQVDAQFWYRDPAATFGSGLSDAVGFTLCP